MQPLASIITPHDLGLSRYALFTIAIQLKVYPCMFVLMLVDRWRALRENGTGESSCSRWPGPALLFVLGANHFHRVHRWIDLEVPDVRRVR